MPVSSITIVVNYSLVGLSAASASATASIAIVPSYSLVGLSTVSAALATES